MGLIVSEIGIFAFVPSSTITEVRHFIHKMRNIISGLSSWNEWLIVWVIGNALPFILSGRCKELDFEVRET